jgi:hypothetical protein
MPVARYGSRSSWGLTCTPGWVNGRSGRAQGPPEYPSTCYTDIVTWVREAYGLKALIG